MLSSRTLAARLRQPTTSLLRHRVVVVQGGQSKTQWTCCATDNRATPIPIFQQQPRFFSSAAATATADVPSMEEHIVVPIKHSRKLPPPTCRDITELQEHTDHLLTTPLGSLYAYQDSHDSNSNEALFKAWEAADTSIQLAEYVLRGHASWIPNSQYYSSDDDNAKSPLTPVQHVQRMQAVLDRLQEEGKLYMELRQGRLTQKGKEAAGTTTTTPPEDDSDSSSDSSSSSDEESDTGDNEKSTADSDESDSDDDDKKDHLSLARDYSKDFCPPGPTAVMYDTLLDAMAAATASPQSGSPTVCPWSPEDFASLLSQLLHAHALDGGDLENTNEATYPTMQSYNACLRGIANLPYTTTTIATDDHANKTSASNNDDELRDQAVGCSFGIFNTLTHTPSSRFSRNAATFAYMLQSVDKYVPTSRVKGNVTVALWMQASKLGVVNQSVVDAFVAAQTPSNGEEFVEFLETRQNLQEMPQTWRRNAKSLQHASIY
jgi:hypothetical protein